MGEPKLEALSKAIKLRNVITKLLLRDFNTKSMVRTVDNLAKKYGMSERDAEQYMGLCNRYNIKQILEEYPYWMISEFREDILRCLRNLIRNITIANSIYPTTLYECDMRRHYQNLAICECEILLQEFRYIVNNIAVNANKYINYVVLIDEEVHLLKAWRKTDNKIRASIIANDPMQYTFVSQQYIQYPMVREEQIEPKREINTEVPKMEEMCVLVANSRDFMV
jgi:hypothetical protein